MIPKVKKKECVSKLEIVSVGIIFIAQCAKQDVPRRHLKMAAMRLAKVYSDYILTSAQFLKH